MLKRFNSKIALGVWKRMTGQKGMGLMSSDISNASTPIIQSGRDLNVQRILTSATSSDFEIDATPYAVNDDVMKIRFRKMGMKSIVRRWRKLVRWGGSLFAYFRDVTSPAYTFDEKIVMAVRLRRWQPDDLDEHRRKRQERKVLDIHKQQAKILETRIVEKLTQLRFCHFVTKNDQIHVKKRIKFSRVDVSPYAYIFVVSSLPFGVKMTDIAQEWVTNELCATVNKKVRIELDMWGLRITVEVGSTLSIPNFVQFKDMIDKFPKTAAPLTFIGGVSTNGAPIYRNLADAPHMIIAGQTGAGKSNQENVVITSILYRNDPRLVKCVFFDMKGGVEFSFYEGVPHLLPMSLPEKKSTSKDGGEKIARPAWECDGIIERKHDVIPALEWLVDECERRLRKIKAAKVKNLAEYNRGKRIDKKMPHILIYIDEWAIIRKSEFGKDAQTILGELGNISRSTGFNIVLCTQYPNAEILDPTIAVNFDWRFAFAMTTGASQSVLGGSWDAYGLNPVGRAIFHTNEGNLQVQTPRITNGNIEAIVQGIMTGSENIAGMMGVDVNEILEWALDNMAGRLDHDTLFNQYREKMSRENLRSLLKSMDDKVFDVQGTLYKVVNERGGIRGRRMELAEDTALFEENSALSTPHAAKNDVETPAEAISAPHECTSCGAQAKSNPCEFCGTFATDSTVTSDSDGTKTGE